MAELYKALTDYIPKLQNIEYGRWQPEKQTGDGTQENPYQMGYVVYGEIIKGLIADIYKFADEHPEYELNRYQEILSEKGIEWRKASKELLDVSSADGQSIMCLLMAVVRADRFCEGTLLRVLEIGNDQKWLERLGELD